MDFDIKQLNIGILHNTYLKKGGEDHVAEAEYQLLKNNGFKVHFLQFTNPNNSIKQLFVFLLAAFNPFSFIKCYRWLKQNNIGLLHVHNWFFAASPSVFWAAKLLKVPLVVTLHNYRMICPSGTFIFNGVPYYESMQVSFSWSAIKKGVYRNSAILTFNVAVVIWLNKVIGTWKFVKKYILLTGHSKGVIAGSHLKSLVPKLIIKPNFVDPIISDQKLKRSDHFLFVGRLSNEKGILLLLEAFQGSSHRLTIIGDGPLEKNVKEFAVKNSTITYLGFKDKITINRELQVCSALLFPSIWYETFGLILIEAFATSTPVIASYIGSASIIVKDGFNGLHFEASNTEGLKQKLDEWASFSETEKEYFRKNAYESYTENYTPEKNLEQLTDVYKAAIL